MKTALLQTRYDLLKKIVIDNRGAAAKFWGAITALKDEKLYLCEYKTWQEFCEKEFGFSPQYANRLIAAGEVAQSLEKDGNSEQTLTGGSKSETMVSLSLGVPNISNERQARVLAAVPPEKRAEVLEAAAARGPVTAKAIAAVAAEKKVDAKRAESAPVVDETGHPIPENLHPFWNRRHEIQELMTSLSRVKTVIEKARAEDDVFFRPVNQAIIDQLERSYSFLSDAKPYAVCLTCQGRANDSCRVCKGTGLVSKFGYEVRADKLAREIREKGMAKGRR